MCYTGSHYEGLVPRTEADVDKTVELLFAYLEGRLNVTVNDVPVLRNQILEQSRVLVGGSQKRSQSHEQELASTSLTSNTSRILNFADNLSNFISPLTNSIGGLSESFP